MDYTGKTKAQLLEDISALHKKNGELEAMERECRLQAKNLKSLYVDVGRQKKDLEILYTISSAVHQSFDLQHIYNTALEAAVSLQDIDMAFIYLISDDRKEAVLQAHINTPEDYIQRARRILYPEGVTWKVLNSGQVINVEDIQKDKDIGAAGKAMGIHKALSIPIILEGVVMGVIWFLSYKKGKFSEQEIELNATIGNHIGIAIAKAKLYEELETRVTARTAELEKANLRLVQEIEDRKKLENEVRVVREQHVIVNAIKNLLKDEQYLTSSIAEKLADDVEAELTTKTTLHEALSNREYKVMVMLASGKGIKDIANEMYLTASTVSTYRSRVLEKLNLKTTAELIRYAIKHNLVD